jgi:riboflavin biosynthesis pyrimidine reductase
MSILTPLEVLYETDRGPEVPVPPELATLYGPLRLPSHLDRATIIGNFVTTLDGVVTLNMPGKSGGGPISGEHAHDRMTMGLLRAVADAVVVGAGTLRAVPRHRWTAAYAAPAFAAAYHSLRTSLGRAGPPLNVIVTARGEFDPSLPVFQSGEVPVLIATTTQGAKRIGDRALPPSTQVAIVQDSGRLSAQAILRAVHRARPSRVILVEGGPQLLGDFFAEGCLDELFLTLAPQVAGRDGSVERPGLVAGRRFAPEHPLWGTLASVRRGGSHLFLRYAWGSGAG